MKPRLRDHFEKELRDATEAEACGHWRSAWASLERAHILGQKNIKAHVRVHWRMMAFAWRRKDRRELMGQVPRLVIAGPGSLMGREPKGNTGSSNVGLFVRMPIPEDLQTLLRES